MSTSAAAAANVEKLLLGVEPLGRRRTFPRVPSKESGSANEASLWEANEASRLRALEYLAQRLPGFDVETYCQTVDDNRVAVWQIGSALLEDLGGEDAVEQVLLGRELQRPRLTFSEPDKEGHQGPPFDGVAERHKDTDLAPWRLDPAGLLATFDAGYSAIINSFDGIEPRAAAFAEMLERATRAAVNINVYMSRFAAHGFGAHWDEHDVIIVQVSGRKTWQIFAPSDLSPMRAYNSTDVSEQLLWEGILEPGMALFIPRGWGHRVEGNDDLSIHYTVGINRVRAHQILDLLVNEAPMGPLFRSDVPLDPSAEVTSYERSLFDSASSFGDEVRQLATPELVDRALSASRIRLKHRFLSPFSSVKQVVVNGDWHGLMIEVPAPGGVLWLGENEDANSFSVACAGMNMEISAAALPIVERLFTSEPVTFDELPVVGSPEVTSAFVMDLVRAQVARLRPTAET